MYRFTVVFLNLEMTPTQVKKLVDGKDEKQRVYKELLVIRRCRDVDSFTKMLSTFLTSIGGDFKKYFTEYYIPRKEMWAVCFRDANLPDTNAHAKSFHRVLKHVKFARKRNHVLIEALLQLE